MLIKRLVTGLVSAALLVQPAAAQVSAPAVPPAAPAIAGAEPVYVPQDKIERGLWMQMDDAERELKRSPLVIRDPYLNAYVRSVLCRTVGAGKCAEVRLYLVRTPDFNATMAPNGVMQVWSGLLLRTQNESQLAAVLGHEYVHYENRHSLRLFREIKSKSASAAWLAFTGIGLIASFGLLADMFKFSREMEREADMGGLALMAKAGYDTREASKVWQQLREEMDATAANRLTKSKKDKSGGMFASHPPTAERVAYLAAAAAEQPGDPAGSGAASYAAAMANDWPAFVDDQLKNNDFGSAEYLITSMAKAGWSDRLLYARGELYRRRAGDGDLDKAAVFFSEAIGAGGALPELWRGRGLVLLKLGRSEDGKADLNEYLKRAPGASDKAMIAMMAGGSS